MNSLLTSLYLLSTVLTNFNFTLSTTTIQSIKTPIVLAQEAPQSVIDPTIEKWLLKLSNCESGGNWKALNPKDLDGTPSKGKYQFKDTTFIYFSDKYNIETTSIWNGDEQELLVRKMIEDSEVNLKRQFPACIRKIGLPPVTSPEQVE